MSLNLSTKLEKILKDKFDYSQSKSNQILDFFRNYRTGQWIYPGVLKRQLNITIEDAYKMMSLLEECGAVESWYEYCCGNCQHVLGAVQRFNELPDTFECEFCGNIVSTVENTIKIYKVI